MDTTNAVRALAALSHVARLGIFRHLVELGPDGAFPSDLAQTFDLPGATLSFHLKALLQAGLIEAERSSRNIRYRANFMAMQELIDFLTLNCCGGDRSKCIPHVAAPTSPAPTSPAPISPAPTSPAPARSPPSRSTRVKGRTR